MFCLTKSKKEIKLPEVLALFITSSEEVKLLYGAYNFDKTLWEKAYRQLYRDVVNYSWAPKQLLMFNAEQGDGYEKLCHWLLKPIPDEPYPHI